MQPFTLVIGNKNFSSWSLRAWLALKVAGVEFQEVNIALRQPDTKAQILKYSPSGMVPALVHGDTTVWDSLAICEYIAELFPEKKLWPEDQAARAIARSVSAEMHSGFLALRTNLPMDIQGFFKDFDVPADAQKNINRISYLWQNAREQFGKQGDFLFGQFSIADIMYAPVVSRFHTYDVSLHSKVCKTYMDAVWNHPHMQEWVKAAQKERKAA